MKLRTSRNPLPLTKTAENGRRITEEALRSLRAYRRDRVANRLLPHQPEAA